jgi:MarR family transcriptional regulator, organic hydroperoxide resistance regulator
MPRNSDKFLNNLLPYLLQRASYVVTQQFHAHLKLNGVGVSRWRLLAWLSDHEGSTISELTNQLMLKQPTVTRLVDNAVRDKLVSKISDERDGRRVFVALTKSGEKLIARLKQDALDAENWINNKYEPEAVTHLKDELREIIAEFDEAKIPGK